MSDWNQGLPPINRDERDGTRLISKWYKVCYKKPNITIIRSAYYHVLHGWMIKGKPTEEWKFGYKPLNEKVEGWK